MAQADEATVTSLEMTLPDFNAVGLNKSAGPSVYKVYSDNTKEQIYSGYTLSSDKEDVIKVSDSINNYLMAVGAGTANITATLTENTNISVTVSYTVTLSSDIEYTALHLAIGDPFQTSGNTVKKGKYGAIVVELTDNNGHYKSLERSDYTVESSNQNVLIVGDIYGNVDFDNGTFVYAKGAGEATLTFTYSSGSTTMTGTMSYTVVSTNKDDWDSEDILDDLRTLGYVGSTVNGYASSYNGGDETTYNASLVIGQDSKWLSRPYKDSGDNNDYDAAPWWFIDLGTTYNITAVGTLWVSNAYPGTFDIYTASALTDESGSVSNDNITWTKQTSVTVSDADDATYTSVSYSGVRFIKIQCTAAAAAAATYGVNFTRFYLAGEKANKSMTVTYNDFTGEDNNTYTEKKAVCTGDWVAETFNTIDAYVVDLTSVVGVPSEISSPTASPNAIVYATSASGNNVCTGYGAEVSDLNLTDGKPFRPERWFNITNSSSFTITLTKGQYSFLYLPCDISEIPTGVHLYEIGSVSTSGLTINEVTTASREKHYVIMAETAGTYTLKGSKDDISSFACGTNNLSNTYNSSVSMTATLVEGTAPQNTYMINRSNEIACVSPEAGVTIQPFMAYITTDLSQYMSSSAKLSIIVGGEATNIANVAVEADNNAQLYNLAGQAVNSSYRGIVIKNGKKFVNK